jgi:hypothetical protein
VSSIFYLVWIKIETGDAHKHLVNVVCFMKIGLVKAKLHSGPQIFTFHIYCSILARFYAMDLNIMLLDNHEFNEEGHRKGHTFIVSVNELHLQLYHHLPQHYCLGCGNIA